MFGFYDFEFFLCAKFVDPGVDVSAVFRMTDVSTAELLMADCWLVLLLLIELVPPLWTRWIAASSLAFTGLTEEPLMV